MPTDYFHPSVSHWFQQNVGSPTDAQSQAWPVIAAGDDCLVAAPTGSGKTLAAFLAAINALVIEDIERGLPEQTRILYISPLKALSVDVEKNLQHPLTGIANGLLEQGIAASEIRTGVRSGDTPATARARMVRKPPHILVTTPESLYLLLTSESGRGMLANVRTVIIDELHALADSKRGAHLMLSLERLDALQASSDRPRPQRIGLSATQKPIEVMADYLQGQAASKPCQIVDSGHSRERDLALMVPRSPLTAVMEGEVWQELYIQLSELIEDHRTTLIFVNTRRLAERAARFLADRIGEENVTAHHGSLSKEHRLDAEQRLKAGKLQALVATAALELGIDIGDIDLVVQIGSPRAIATFLQRVGRAGHQVGGTPKGRLFPTSRDELVECTALLDAVQLGELDAIRFCEQPLDVLAQQIVAELARSEWDEQALYERFRSAWPYRDLPRETFTQVVKMLADGFSTRRGRRSAHIHRDAVNGRLRGRRSAPMTALMNGGTIPDQFDYDVILQPEGVFIGTLNEDFAFESLPGDIFQLGNTSYRVQQVRPGKVHVEDAHGLPPSMPFWFGEAPGRSDELSAAVSRLREQIDKQLCEQEPAAVVDWLQAKLPMESAAAEQLVEYLATARAALTVLPTQDTIVFERFFDGNGDLHFVIHSSFGSRINRAWGLSLRKRFCRKFNFELQAAALEDSIVLSLGATHSFPIDEPIRYLNSNSVRDVLIQALLDAPMFEARWRWNASIALAIPRMRNGRKQPAQFQRNDAEDLIALVFPDQIACLENIAGAREVPDHPLVEQTLADCLDVTMDIKGLEALLKRIEANEINLVCRELTAPSPLCEEVINARPYAFLDDGDAENRRTLAIERAGPFTPDTAADLGRLDSAAIERVRDEIWPNPRSADELHDALVTFGFLTSAELASLNSNETELDLGVSHFTQELVDCRRIAQVSIQPNLSPLWVAAERLADCLAIYGPDNAECALTLPASESLPEPELALKEWIRSRLEGLGPVTEAQIGDACQLSVEQIQPPLLALEQEGFAMRGFYQAGVGELQWCDRRLLARIHRYTLKRRRNEVQTVSLAQYQKFLLHWQGLVEPGVGLETLAQRLEQIAGVSAPASCWEQEILPARVRGYGSFMLDQLGAGGQIVWARMDGLHAKEKQPRRNGPIKATPICLLPRASLNTWRLFAPLPATDEIELSSTAQRIWDSLNNNGSQFFADLALFSGLLPSQCEDGLKELVAWGLVSADGFAGLRALLQPASQNRPTPRGRRRKNGSPRGQRIGFGSMDAGGRWTLLSKDSAKHDDAIEDICWTLLQRYGVISRAIISRENRLPPWRQLLYVLRRLEARDEIRGGRFIDRLSGEQFALSEALPLLKKPPAIGTQTIALAASDPANLLHLTHPSRSLPNVAGNQVLLQVGELAGLKAAGEVFWLDESKTANQTLDSRLPDCESIRRAKADQVENDQKSGVYWSK